MGDTSDQWLPLLDAMIAWCDPVLLEAVKDRERWCTFERLRGFSCPALLPKGDHASSRDYRVSTEDQIEGLTFAWHDLNRDFCDRVIRGEISIQGVQIAPELETEHRSIPRFWAREFSFELHENAIRFKEWRYTAVRASRTPLSDSPAAQPLPPPAKITPAAARRLSDDDVLTLLEDHARRVVEEPHAKLMPSRMSLMPIIARKMRHRAATGELHAELASEADELERWIKGKAPSHQTPGASTIKNSIRDEYRKLKPQSKGIKA